MLNNDVLPFGSSFHPNPEAIFQRIGDDLVIINLKTDRIYSLNKTAARFWELLEAHKTIPEIKAQLGVEFEVESETLDKEIQTILNNLIKEGLVLANHE